MTVPALSVSGLNVFLGDGAGNPHDACEPITGFTSGTVALIDRGTCFFRDKVVNAQSVGAIGVIVAGAGAVFINDNAAFAFDFEFCSAIKPCAIHFGVQCGDSFGDNIGHTFGPLCVNVTA